MGWVNRHLTRTFLVLILITSVSARAEQPVVIDGLKAPARVLRDAEGIPHILATTDLDAALLLGYVHAEDRFFLMDFLRRSFDGTLAEVMGENALPSDVQFQLFDLRRLAVESFAALPEASRSWAEAYARGVNAYLEANPLPPEYARFELTKASVPAWKPEDAVLLLKGFALGAWLDLGDISRTLDLAAYQAAGQAHGFDGTALFSEDVQRMASFLPAVTAPKDLESITPGSARALGGNQMLASAELSEDALELARRYRDQVAQIPSLHEVLSSHQSGVGSNWWLVGGEHTDSGAAILASDSHQNLNMPTPLYETHLLVFDQERVRALNSQGATIAGVPAILIGCNPVVCWGATNGRLDFSDVFQEEVLFDPDTGEPTHTVYQGQPEPLVVVDRHYRVNQLGDGVPDNLEAVELPPLAGGRSYYVPRRSGGPLLSIGTPVNGVAVGLSSQYTGWSVSRDLEAYRRMLRVRNVEQFAAAVAYADSFTFNFPYADVFGNIGYFFSGEVPLREDLQELEHPDGLPPWFIRDGTGAHRNEWLPVANFQEAQGTAAYEILPNDEMPHVVNPAQGYLISSNNDPQGLVVDNDPINQRRPGGGVMYLNYWFPYSFRFNQIRNQLETRIADGGKISVQDIRDMQANNQLLDAEYLLPYLLAAFERAGRPGAEAQLAPLAADPRMSEAISRLAAWDFSTPTGIREGYDPGDDPDHLQEPKDEEVRASVAATLYSVWRSQLIREVIDGTLTDLGLGDHLPSDRQAYTGLFHLLQTFDQTHGVGASGVDFFAVEGVADAALARDLRLLGALKDGLDELSGDAYEDAFHHSTDLADYRWGYLHRTTIRHVAIPEYSVPPMGGFSDLSPELPGIARAGGFETIDAATHDLRGAGSQGFTFRLMPQQRRYTVLAGRNDDSFQIVPGGPSGDPSSPFYARQLGRHLTNQYAPVLVRSVDVQANRVTRELFEPAP